MDNLYHLDNDPEVMRHVTGGTTTPREEIEHDYLPAFLSYYNRFEGYGFWAVIEKATGQFLGWVHLRPRQNDPVDQPELGYRLRRGPWGNGFGTEGVCALKRKAFTDLGAQRVAATAFKESLASCRVMEKSGMTLTRAYRLSSEELVDMLGPTTPEHLGGEAVEYAITKREWEAQDRSPSTGVVKS